MIFISWKVNHLGNRNYLAFSKDKNSYVTYLSNTGDSNFPRNVSMLSLVRALKEQDILYKVIYDNNIL